VNAFLKSLSTLPAEKLVLDFSIKPEVKTTALDACGIVILNPPWKLEENLVREVLPYLRKYGDFS